MKNFVGFTNVALAIVAALAIAHAISFSDRSSFTFAEAALAGTLWSRAVTVVVLVLTGCVIYKTIVGREDVVALRNELREIQNRLGSVQAAIVATAQSPTKAAPLQPLSDAIVSLPHQPSPPLHAAISSSPAQYEMQYRSIPYWVHADYTISATVRDEVRGWRSLDEFRQWVDGLPA